MRIRHPHRPSAAMVVAVVALAVALSGSAYAVSANIKGSELKNRSVAGIKLERHTLTATEFNTTKGGFIRGKGHLAFARLVLAPGQNSELLRVPGFVDVRAECSSDTKTAPPSVVFTYFLNSTPPAEVLWTTFRQTPGSTTGSVTTSDETVSAGGPLTDSGSQPFSDMLRVGQGAGPNAKVGVITTWADRGVGARGRCRVNAEVDFNG